MQSLTINATIKRPNITIELFDFGVFKTWYLLKYNVRTDSIYKAETLISTHQVKNMECAISHDSRSF